MEITNICPLPCHDESRNAQSRQPGLMDLSTFRSIITNSTEAGLSHIDLSGAGEPLLHPRIGDFVSYISNHAPNVTTRLITNGLLLNPPLFHQLKHQGLSSVIVVLSPQHIPTDIKNTDGEKKRLFEDLRKICADSVDIQIKHANNKWSAEEKEKIKKYWADRGLTKVEFTRRLACGVVLGNPDREKGHRPPQCMLFAHQHYVSWDGKLLSCCHDNSGETTIGNFSKDHIPAIIEKKAKIIERQYFYAICYTCKDERRFPIRGPVIRAFARLFKSR